VREHARWSLERVGLADKANARADTLSGGQAQRVAIARALCQRASVILADEPVASLDPRAADEILALLADVAHREHVGVLCVLHQPDLARRYADRLVGIAHGSVSFDDAPDRISDAAIADLYDGLGEAAATVSTTSPRWRRIALWSVVAVALAALYRHGWVDTEVSLGSLVDGFHNLVDITKGAWPPARGVLRDSIDASIVTFDTALLGTTIALLFAVIVAPLAASNTSPSRAVYELTRTLIAILRTIPDVIFALLFVVAVGLGPFAGVLAIGLHSIGTLGKLFAEAIEEIEMGPVNALRVAGARRLQVFVHAVVPSVASTWTSLLLYRFDVNIRSSIILGIVGAGGIGFNISNSMQLFQYREVTTELGVMLVLVLVVERASSLLRRRIG
jgi:phosphonate transport system permease protein